MASRNDEADIDDSVQSGNPLIDGLLTEYHWSQFARSNFQFTIPDSETDYEDTRDFLIADYPDDNHIGIIPMPSWMMFGISDVIVEFNKILNFEITFQQDNNFDTQLRYGLADLTHDTSQYEGDTPPPAYAHVPQDDGLTTEQANWMSGDMFFNKDDFTNAPTRPNGTAFTDLVGTFEHYALLHETGHALGLKHSHETAHGNNPVPLHRDSMEFTVMAYRHYIGDTTSGVNSSLTGHFAQSLMMLDIQALQYLYGADFTTQSSDTTYRWDTQGRYFINGAEQWNTDTNVIFHTIWDGGGNDTYDFSAFSTNQTINLAPGGWTNLGAQLANLGDGKTARANVFNALQYQNNATDTRSLIENAIGGSGVDRIDGNFVANRLDGGGSDDTIFGGLGNDTLIGGDGGDLLNGGEGFDTAEYSAAAGETITIRPIGTDPSLGRWSITGAAQGAGDILAQIEAFRFGNGSDTILTVGTNPAFSFNLDGRGGNDIINGGVGTDTLIGGAGTDSLRPGAGVFHVFGGQQGATSSSWIESLADNDELIIDRTSDPDGFNLSFLTPTGPEPLGRFVGDDGSTARGIARLDYFGGVGVDFIVGALGNDIMRGRGNSDSLSGNTGDDTLYGDEGADTLQGGENNDKLFGGEGQDFLAGGNGNDRIETGTGGDRQVFGGAGNDVLIGSADAEVLDGQNDTDRLTGGGGFDTMTGGAGRDTFIFITTADSSTSTPDLIQDFLVSGDRIDLARIDANAGGGTPNDMFNFIGTGAFTAPGQVRAVQTGSSTILELNTSGAAGAEGAIHLGAVTATALTGANFIL